MNKRPFGQGSDAPYSGAKKHKSGHKDRHGGRPDERNGHREETRKRSSASGSYQDSISNLPPRTATLGDVPAYTPFTVLPGLPPLPEIHDSSLRSAPFKHKSTASYDRSTVRKDTTYEQLEFLGDAQLELLASRLIYERFSFLTAGQQSQLRELLVRNETLAEYARAYGFDKRVEVGDLQRMQQDAKDRGNKGFNKVLGDVFEAYIAAVILSDAENGFAEAEKWMTALWAPKLVEAAARDRSLTIHHADSADPRTVYNPAGKIELQKRIMRSSQVKLFYEPYQASIELKGDQLGQNRHFIAVYLTGYGYDRYMLGKGEGKNKVEAGNWAATEAMYGESKAIVEECERQVKEIQEKRKAAEMKEKEA